LFGADLIIRKGPKSPDELFGQIIFRDLRLGKNYFQFLNLNKLSPPRLQIGAWEVSRRGNTIDGGQRGHPHRGLMWTRGVNQTRWEREEF